MKAYGPVPGMQQELLPSLTCENDGLPSGVRVTLLSGALEQQLINTLALAILFLEGGTEVESHMADGTWVGFHQTAWG